MKLDSESKEKLGKRQDVGQKCIELAWGRPWAEIDPDDRHSAATDVISDVLTAVAGAAGSWTPTAEGRLEGWNWDGEADEAARGLLYRSLVSWQGDAEDYTETRDE